MSDSLPSQNVPSDEKNTCINGARRHSSSTHPLSKQSDRSDTLKLCPTSARGQTHARALWEHHRVRDGKPKEVILTAARDTPPTASHSAAFGAFSPENASKKTPKARRGSGVLLEEKATASAVWGVPGTVLNGVIENATTTRDDHKTTSGTAPHAKQDAPGKDSTVVLLPAPTSSPDTWSVRRAGGATCAREHATQSAHRSRSAPLRQIANIAATAEEMKTAAVLAPGPNAGAHHASSSSKPVPRSSRSAHRSRGSRRGQDRFKQRDRYHQRERCDQQNNWRNRSGSRRNSRRTLREKSSHHREKRGGSYDYTRKSEPRGEKKGSRRKDERHRRREDCRKNSRDRKDSSGQHKEESRQNSRDRRDSFELRKDQSRRDSRRSRDRRGSVGRRKDESRRGSRRKSRDRKDSAGRTNEEFRRNSRRSRDRKGARRTRDRKDSIGRRKDRSAQRSRSSRDGVRLRARSSQMSSGESDTSPSQSGSSSSSMRRARNFRAANFIRRHKSASSSPHRSRKHRSSGHKDYRADGKNATKSIVVAYGKSPVKHRDARAAKHRSTKKARKKEKKEKARKKMRREQHQRHGAGDGRVQDSASGAAMLMGGRNSNPNVVTAVVRRSRTTCTTMSQIVQLPYGSALGSAPLPYYNHHGSGSASCMSMSLEHESTIGRLWKPAEERKVPKGRDRIKNKLGGHQDPRFQNGGASSSGSDSDSSSSSDNDDSSSSSRSDSDSDSSSASGSSDSSTSESTQRHGRVMKKKARGTSTAIAMIDNSGKNKRRNSRCSSTARRESSAKYDDEKKHSKVKKKAKTAKLSSSRTRSRARRTRTGRSSLARTGRISPSSSKRRRRCPDRSPVSVSGSMIGTPKASGTEFTSGEGGATKSDPSETVTAIIVKDDTGTLSLDKRKDADDAKKSKTPSTSPSHAKTRRKTRKTEERKDAGKQENKAVEAALPSIATSAVPECSRHADDDTNSAGETIKRCETTHIASAARVTLDVTQSCSTVATTRFEAVVSSTSSKLVDMQGQGHKGTPALAVLNGGTCTTESLSTVLSVRCNDDSGVSLLSHASPRWEKNDVAAHDSTGTPRVDVVVVPPDKEKSTSMGHRRRSVNEHVDKIEELEDNSEECNKVDAVTREDAEACNNVVVTQSDSKCGSIAQCGLKSPASLTAVRAEDAVALSHSRKHDGASVEPEQAGTINEETAPEKSVVQGATEDNTPQTAKTSTIFVSADPSASSCVFPPVVSLVTDCTTVHRLQDSPLSETAIVSAAHQTSHPSSTPANLSVDAEAVNPANVSETCSASPSAHLPDAPLSIARDLAHVSDLHRVSRPPSPSNSSPPSSPRHVCRTVHDRESRPRPRSSVSRSASRSDSPPPSSTSRPASLSVSPPASLPGSLPTSESLSGVSPPSSPVARLSPTRVAALAAGRQASQSVSPHGSRASSPPAPSSPVTPPKRKRGALRGELSDAAENTQRTELSSHKTRGRTSKASPDKANDEIKLTRDVSLTCGHATEGTTSLRGDTHKGADTTLDLLPSCEVPRSGEEAIEKKNKNAEAQSDGRPSEDVYGNSTEERRSHLESSTEGVAEKPSRPLRQTPRALHGVTADTEPSRRLHEAGKTIEESVTNEVPAVPTVRKGAHKTKEASVDTEVTEVEPATRKKRRGTKKAEEAGAKKEVAEEEPAERQTLKGAQKAGEAGAEEKRTQEEPAVRQEKAQDEPAVHKERAQEGPAVHKERAQEEPAVHKERAQEEPVVHKERAQEESAVHEERAQEEPAVHKERAQAKDAEVQDEVVKAKLGTRKARKGATQSGNVALEDEVGKGPPVVRKVRKVGEIGEGAPLRWDVADKEKLRACNIGDVEMKVQEAGCKDVPQRETGALRVRELGRQVEQESRDEVAEDEKLAALKTRKFGKNVEPEVYNEVPEKEDTAARDTRMTRKKEERAVQKEVAREEELAAHKVRGLGKTIEQEPQKQVAKEENSAARKIRMVGKKEEQAVQKKVAGKGEPAAPKVRDLGKTIEQGSPKQVAKEEELAAPKMRQMGKRVEREAHEEVPEKEEPAAPKTRELRKKVERQVNNDVVEKNEFAEPKTRELRKKEEQVVQKEVAEEEDHAEPKKPKLGEKIEPEARKEATEEKEPEAPRRPILGERVEKEAQNEMAEEEDRAGAKTRELGEKVKGAGEEGAEEEKVEASTVRQISEKTERTGEETLKTLPAGRRVRKVGKKVEEASEHGVATKDPAERKVPKKGEKLTGAVEENVAEEESAPCKVGDVRAIVEEAVEEEGAEEEHAAREPGDVQQEVRETVEGEAVVGEPATLEKPEVTKKVDEVEAGRKQAEGEPVGRRGRRAGKKVEQVFEGEIVKVKSTTRKARKTAKKTEEANAEKDVVEEDSVERKVRKVSKKGEEAAAEAEVMEGESPERKVRKVGKTEEEVNMEEQVVEERPTAREAREAEHRIEEIGAEEQVVEEEADTQEQVVEEEPSTGQAPKIGNVVEEAHAVESWVETSPRNLLKASKKTKEAEARDASEEQPGRKLPRKSAKKMSDIGEEEAGGRPANKVRKASKKTEEAGVEGEFAEEEPTARKVRRGSKKTEDASTETEVAEEGPGTRRKRRGAKKTEEVGAEAEVAEEEPATRRKRKGAKKTEEAGAEKEVAEEEPTERQIRKGAEITQEVSVEEEVAEVEPPERQVRKEAAKPEEAIAEGEAAEEEPTERQVRKGAEKTQRASVEEKAAKEEPTERQKRKRAEKTQEASVEGQGAKVEPATRKKRKETELPQETSAEEKVMEVEPTERQIHKGTEVTKEASVEGEVAEVDPVTQKIWGGTQDAKEANVAQDEVAHEEPATRKMRREAQESEVTATEDELVQEEAATRKVRKGAKKTDKADAEDALVEEERVARKARRRAKQTEAADAQGAVAEEEPAARKVRRGAKNFEDTNAQDRKPARKRKIQAKPVTRRKRLSTPDESTQDDDKSSASSKAGTKRPRTQPTTTGEQPAASSQAVPDDEIDSEDSKQEPTTTRVKGKHSVAKAKVARKRILDKTASCESLGPMKKRRKLAVASSSPSPSSQSIGAPSPSPSSQSLGAPSPSTLPPSPDPEPQGREDPVENMRTPRKTVRKNKSALATAAASGKAAEFSEPSTREERATANTQESSAAPTSADTDAVRDPSDREEGKSEEEEGSSAAGPLRAATGPGVHSTATTKVAKKGTKSASSGSGVPAKKGRPRKHKEPERLERQESSAASSSSTAVPTNVLQIHTSVNGESAARRPPSRSEPGAVLSRAQSSTADLAASLASIAPRPRMRPSPLSSSATVGGAMRPRPPRVAVAAHARVNDSESDSDSDCFVVPTPNMPPQFLSTSSILEIIEDDDEDEEVGPSQPSAPEPLDTSAVTTEPQARQAQGVSTPLPSSQGALSKQSDASPKDTVNNGTRNSPPRSISSSPPPRAPDYPHTFLSHMSKRAEDTPVTPEPARSRATTENPALAATSSAHVAENESASRGSCSGTTEPTTPIGRGERQHTPRSCSAATEPATPTNRGEQRQHPSFQQHLPQRRLSQKTPVPKRRLRPTRASVGRATLAHADDNASPASRTAGGDRMTESGTTSPRHAALPRPQGRHAAQCDSAASHLPVTQKDDGDGCGKSRALVRSSSSSSTAVCATQKAQKTSVPNVRNHVSSSSDDVPGPPESRNFSTQPRHRFPVSCPSAAAAGFRPPPVYPQQEIHHMQQERMHQKHQLHQRQERAAHSPRSGSQDTAPAGTHNPAANPPWMLPPRPPLVRVDLVEANGEVTSSMHRGDLVPTPADTLAADPFARITTKPSISLYELALRQDATQTGKICVRLAVGHGPGTPKSGSSGTPTAMQPRPAPRRTGDPGAASLDAPISTTPPASALLHIADAAPVTETHNTRASEATDDVPPGSTLVDGTDPSSLTHKKQLYGRHERRRTDAVPAMSSGASSASAERSDRDRGCDPRDRDRERYDRCDRERERSHHRGAFSVDGVIGSVPSHGDTGARHNDLASVASHRRCDPRGSDRNVVGDRLYHRERRKDERSSSVCEEDERRRHTTAPIKARRIIVELVDPAGDRIRELRDSTMRVQELARFREFNGSAFRLKSISGSIIADATTLADLCAEGGRTVVLAMEVVCAQSPPQSDK